MKKTQSKRKLQLSKKTISLLDKISQVRLKGGDQPLSGVSGCLPDTAPPDTAFDTLKNPPDTARKPDTV
jgi:hypothetical protein